MTTVQQLHYRFLVGMTTFLGGGTVSVTELVKGGSIAVTFIAAVIAAIGAYYGMRAKKLEVEIRTLELNKLRHPEAQATAVANQEQGQQDSSSA